MSIKLFFVAIGGVALLIVSSFFLIVPRYREISELRAELENRLEKLESAYNKYISQKKALENLRKVLKSPPKIEGSLFEGLSVRRVEDRYVISGDVSGDRIVKLVDYFMRNPSSYISSLRIVNSLDTPITISTKMSTPSVHMRMEVRVMELIE